MSLQYIDNLTNQPIPIPEGWTPGQPQYYISDSSGQFTFANVLTMIFGLPMSEYTPQVYTLNIPISMLEEQQKQLFFVISPNVTSFAASGVISFQAIGRFDNVDYSADCVWTTVAQNSGYPDTTFANDGVFVGSTLTTYTPGSTYLVIATLPDGPYGICTVVV
jgi:hypothetical protein